MGINERSQNFREADRKYAEAVRRRDAGEMSHEEFDAERKRLMILDKDGRWWAKSAATGEWKFHDGNEWVPGSPPGYTAAEEAEAESGGEEGADADGAGHVEGPAREVVDGDEARRPSLRRPIAVAALLLAVLLVGGGYFLTRGMTLTSGTGEAGGMGVSEGAGGAVPDLIGASSVEEARETAGGDFEVAAAGRVESEEPIGSVVSQDPASGERADEGSAIFVETSGGVPVPDVEGEKRGDAERILEAAGFEVEVEADESSEENEGKVVAQEPRADESAEAGSSVDVTVGEGPGDGGDGGEGGGVVNPEPEAAPPADARIPVPDVIGESVEEAERTLEDAGFSTDTEHVESDLAAGTVVATDPGPGSLLDPSVGKVDIEASLGPPETAPESPPDEQYVPPEGKH